MEPVVKRKVGRPSKEELAQRELDNLKVLQVANYKQRGSDEKTMVVTYRCVHCGAAYYDPDKKFYRVTSNEAYRANNYYAPVCCKCTKEMFQEYILKYKSEKKALLLICFMLGYYFSESLYESMKESGEEFVLGNYIKALNGVQYKKRTSDDYIMEFLGKGGGFTPQAELRGNLEERWKAADKKNKFFCIRELGFDPFDEDVYSSEDRRYMFNLLSNYLTEEVLEDSHKKMSCIELVKTNLQLMLINNRLNTIMKTSQNLGDAKDANMIKDRLVSTINAIAKENGISVSGSGRKGKKTNTFTSIMKEMLENGVTEAKSNFTEVKMTDAFRHVAEISAKALVNEMNLTGDDYATMAARQADTIRELNAKLDEVEEELRLTTIELREAKEKKPSSIKTEIDLQPEMEAQVEPDE